MARTQGSKNKPKTLFPVVDNNKIALLDKKIAQLDEDIALLESKIESYREIIKTLLEVTE
jgi:chaperonin GroEL (HSP60 family)